MISALVYLSGEDNGQRAKLTTTAATSIMGVITIIRLRNKDTIPTPPFSFPFLSEFILNTYHKCVLLEVMKSQVDLPSHFFLSELLHKQEIITKTMRKSYNINLVTL